MTDKEQLIETVLERDVDLILLEEFNSNNYFAEWFVTKLELPILTKNIATFRSISDFGLGETDLLFSYESNSKIIFVLIENKVDANFGDQQFERYRQRAEKYLTNGQCAEYFIVLIAPKQYAESQNYFETYITYEDIKQYFEFSNDRRLLFKANLLKIAIEKLRRGYQPQNSVPVQKFWHSYWSFKEKKYPEFRMNKPSIVPFGSDWIEMRHEELKGLIFYHKLGRGYIDATFCSFPEEIEFSIKTSLPENYTFEKHKSGRFSIRQKIASIDRTADFDSQVESVKVGMMKIHEVMTWIRFELKKNTNPHKR